MRLGDVERQWAATKESQNKIKNERLRTGKEDRVREREMKVIVAQLRSSIWVSRKDHVRLKNLKFHYCPQIPTKPL